MKVVYQNTIIEESQLQFPMSNRAFLYGDGFFETILFAHGTIPHLEYHFKRITKAISQFEFLAPTYFNINYLQEKITELCNTNNLPLARVKIIIWRADGGLYTPDDNHLNFVITSATFLPQLSTKNKVEIYPEPINNYTPISEFKPLSASKYVLAGLFKKKNQLDDVILLGQNNLVSEALYSNLFWEKDGILMTPSIRTGCVSGVMRSIIVSSKNVVEVQDTADSLLGADSIFTTNALGIQHIEQVNGKKFNRSQTTELLSYELVGKYL